MDVTGRHWVVGGSEIDWLPWRVPLGTWAYGVAVTPVRRVDMGVMSLRPQQTGSSVGRGSGAGYVNTAVG